MMLNEKTLAEVERRLAEVDVCAIPALGDLIAVINALIAALREAWRERDEARDQRDNNIQAVENCKRWEQRLCGMLGTKTFHTRDEIERRITELRATEEGKP